MNRVVVPLPTLLALLRKLRDRGPLRCPIGQHATDDGTAWLLRHPAASEEPACTVELTDDLAGVADVPADAVGRLALARDPRQGLAVGLLRTPEGLAPVDELALVGPGMYVLPLTASARVPDVPDAARWSRTRGAIGADTHARLATLRYAIVGAGRTGSAVAHLLVQGLGVSRVVLIDPDRVEAHNQGESTGLPEGSVGRPKAQVLAEVLGTRALAVVESITGDAARRAVANCEVVFACVDDDGARLATATLATLFAKPLLDLGAGVHGTGPERRLGADVRLLLPGDRCLLCLGGINDVAGAAFLGERRERAWRSERAGSLRSLATLTAATAVRLWEDCVGERVRDSRWLRLEYGTDGRLTTEQRSAPRVEGCGLCRLLGQGGD